MGRGDQRRTTGALVASILVHVALLLMLLRVAGSSPPVSQTHVETDFQVQLITQRPEVPRPLSEAPAVPARRPRGAVVSPAAPQPRATPVRAARAIQPTRSPPTRSAPAAAAPQSRPFASAPAASPPGVGPTGGPTGGGRWAVQGDDDDGGGVRRFLRATVGCSHEDYVGLSGTERAACDRRIGQEARSMGIPADKLASFIAAAQAQERQSADRTGPMRDLFVPCKGEESNLDRGCINMKTKHPEDEP